MWTYIRENTYECKIARGINKNVVVNEQKYKDCKNAKMSWSIKHTWVLIRIKFRAKVII